MAHGSLLFSERLSSSAGLAGNEILFEACLYELHEIFLKYSPTHTFVFCGDFNASQNRGDHLRRDVLFKKFVMIH